MKKSILLSVVIAASLVISCTRKQQLVSPDNARLDDNTETPLSLSNARYEEIITGLRTASEDTTDQLTIPTSPSGRIENIQAYGEALNDFNIAKYQRLIGKYPELKGFKSMLSTYITALSTKDIAVLQSFADQYPSFLTYIKELKLLALTIPVEKAAVLTTDGTVKLDDNLVTFTRVKTGAKVEGSKAAKTDAYYWMNEARLYSPDNYHQVVCINQVWSNFNPITKRDDFTYKTDVYTGIAGFGAYPFVVCGLVQKYGSNNYYGEVHSARGHNSSHGTQASRSEWPFLSGGYFTWANYAITFYDGYYTTLDEYQIWINYVASH